MQHDEQKAKGRSEGILQIRLPSDGHTALRVASSLEKTTMAKKVEETMEDAMAGTLDLVQKKVDVKLTQVKIDPEVLDRFVEFAKKNNVSVNGLLCQAVEAKMKNRSLPEVIKGINGLMYKHRHSNSPRPPLPPTKDAA